ncbi:DUF3052 domain-containing protein [Microbacterium amylolyticum]|uniref:DUF3052 domain-containing protein n=1 Tax=Microbacterium amylolyticum TaxID=936337 RepID=A0ABS4ZE86_9MICO|nr:DUF3052 domain-containing protein [Microbacterium amylolyticum]MBP2435592.1 hypothetical protein [Microbacterium amylolyticum]
MPRTVAEKLLIAPESELLLLATPEQRTLLEPLPDGVTVADGITRDTEGVAVAFVDDRAGLDALLAEIVPVLTSFRAGWIAYRKGGRSDINRDSIWARVEEIGWTLNANISLSDEWSAVRFKRST